MVILAQWTIILFGLFIISVGLMMLFAPEKERATLRKAGSTNFINYAEITIRMIPAIGMIYYAEYSKYPEVLAIFGWFILGTSLILYFVPRQWHHGYSLKSAEILNPILVRILSPLAFLFGWAVIYSVL